MSPCKINVYNSVDYLDLQVEGNYNKTQKFIFNITLVDIFKDWPK